MVLSPVTMERHRGKKSRRGCDQREWLFRCTIPPAVSAWRVMYITGLGLLAASREPDERIDVLGAQLDRLGIGATDRHQVLPDELNGVRRIERGEPDVLQPGGVLRLAAELPLRLPHRYLQTRLRLELLEIRLARAVGVGLGEGELGVDVEQ